MTKMCPLIQIFKIRCSDDPHKNKQRAAEAVNQLIQPEKSPFSMNASESYGNSFISMRASGAQSVSCPRTGSHASTVQTFTSPLISSWLHNLSPSWPHQAIGSALRYHLWAKRGAPASSGAERPRGYQSYQMWRLLQRRREPPCRGRIQCRI